MKLSITVRKVGIAPTIVSLNLGSSYRDAIEKANSESGGLYQLKSTQEVKFNGTVVTFLDNEIPSEGMIVISNRTDSGK